MAFFSGTEGRVVVGAVNFAGINKWSFSKTIAITKSTNFESPADAAGNVWNTKLKGTADGKGSCEGLLLEDTTNSEELVPLGTEVALDLLVSKAAPVGFTDLPAVVTSLTFGTDLNGNATFKMDFETNGVPAILA